MDNFFNKLNMGMLEDSGKYNKEIYGNYKVKKEVGTWINNNWEATPYTNSFVYQAYYDVEPNFYKPYYESRQVTNHNFMYNPKIKAKPTYIKLHDGTKIEQFRDSDKNKYSSIFNLIFLILILYLIIYI